MKISKFLPMLLFLGVLSFTSCNDDDDEEDPPAPTRSELLTAKNWSISELTVNPALAIGQNGNPETNLIPFTPACVLDDFENYNSGGTFTWEEGASKCDPNDPDIFASGNWLWNSDETKLIVQENDGSSIEFTIVSISSTEMVRERVEVDQAAQVTYTFTETLN
ncbi:MAG: hypothetical protein AAGC47_08975 [Bacteroidota bacterium]